MGELTLIYDSISVTELSVPRSDDTLVGLNLSFSKLFLGCQVKLADRSKLLNKMYDFVTHTTYPCLRIIGCHTHTTTTTTTQKSSAAG